MAGRSVSISSAERNGSLRRRRSNAAPASPEKEAAPAPAPAANDAGKLIEAEKSETGRVGERLYVPYRIDAITVGRWVGSASFVQPAMYFFGLAIIMCRKTGLSCPLYFI